MAENKPVLLYVVYRDGAPVELAQGDSATKLLEILKGQYVSVEGVTLRPATECPVEHVVHMTMILLAKWAFAQFTMMGAIQGSGRIVRPT